jgi:hypothetical protein
MLFRRFANELPKQLESNSLQYVFRELEFFHLIAFEDGRLRLCTTFAGLYDYDYDYEINSYYVCLRV